MKEVLIEIVIRQIGILLNSVNSHRQYTKMRTDGVACCCNTTPQKWISFPGFVTWREISSIKFPPSFAHTRTLRKQRKHLANSVEIKAIEKKWREKVERGGEGESTGIIKTSKSVCACLCVRTAFLLQHPLKARTGQHFPSFIAQPIYVYWCDWWALWKQYCESRQSPK